MLIIIINHRIKYKYLTSCGRHSSGAENPGIRCKTYLDQLFNLISLNYLQKYIFAVGCHQPWTRISSMISRRCFLENRSASFSLRELFSLMSTNQEKIENFVEKNCINKKFLLISTKYHLDIVSLIAQWMKLYSQIFMANLYIYLCTIHNEIGVDCWYCHSVCVLIC